MTEIPQSTQEQRRIVLYEFNNYVDLMSEGIIVSSLHKKFTERIKYLIANYETSMDIRDGLK